jgi:hypothetical protein
LASIFAKTEARQRQKAEFAVGVSDRSAQQLGEPVPQLKLRKDRIAFKNEPIDERKNARSMAQGEDSVRLPCRRWKFLKPPSKVARSNEGAALWSPECMFK